MNILDFYKMNHFLNKYFGFSLFASKMVVTKCPNSSEIIQGSLGDIFQFISGGLLPIQGPQEGSEAIFWPYFGILNNFPHF